MKNVQEVIARSPLRVYNARLEQMGLPPQARQTALNARVGAPLPPLDARLSKQAGNIFEAAINVGIDPIPTLKRITELVGTKPTSINGTRGRERKKIIVGEGTKEVFETLANITQRKQRKEQTIFERY